MPGLDPVKYLTAVGFLLAIGSVGFLGFKGATFELRAAAFVLTLTAAILIMGRAVYILEVVDV